MERKCLMSFFRRHRIIPVIFALMLVVVACGGCELLHVPALNVKHSKELRIGMTKQQVLDIMGKPVEGEAYCTPDVWFYYVEVIWLDGLITQDECMPLVFNEGKLVGWGNTFYNEYRMRGHGSPEKRDQMERVQ